LRHGKNPPDGTCQRYYIPLDQDPLDRTAGTPYPAVADRVAVVDAEATGHAVLEALLFSLCSDLQPSLRTSRMAHGRERSRSSLTPMKKC